MGSEPGHQEILVKLLCMHRDWMMNPESIPTPGDKGGYLCVNTVDDDPRVIQQMVANGDLHLAHHSDKAPNRFYAPTAQGVERMRELAQAISAYDAACAPGRLN